CIVSPSADQRVQHGRFMGSRIAGRARGGAAGIGLGGGRRIERAMHTAAGKAQRAQKEERDGNGAGQAALHLTRLDPICSRNTKRPSKLTPFQGLGALFSPSPRPFPTALSNPLPFYAHSVAPFPHGWCGFSRN